MDRGLKIITSPNPFCYKLLRVIDNNGQTCSLCSCVVNNSYQVISSVLHELQQIKLAEF